MLWGCLEELLKEGFFAVFSLGGIDTEDLCYKDTVSRILRTGVDLECG